MPSLTNSQRATRVMVALPLVAGVVIMLLFYFAASAHRASKERNSLSLALALFVIPLIVQILALFFLWIRKVNWTYYFFNLTVTTACLIFCAYFWSCYFDDLEAFRLQSLSRGSLYVVLGIIVCVAIMTYAIMRPSSDHFGGNFCTKLNDGIRAHPFWAIIFFFTLFLSVTYLFGFSLAFHNKYSLKESERIVSERPTSITTEAQEIPTPDLRPALRMDNYKSIDDWAAAAKPEMQNAGAQTDSRKPSEFSFYFRPGEAHVQTENCRVDDLPKRLFKTSLSKPISDEMFNDCHLRAMAKRIEETNNGENVKITLIGHGDNEPIRSGRYVSNYELSKARAENVVYEVLQRISEKQKWHNVEWVILPASNEEVDEIAVRLINQNPDELLGKFPQDQIAKGIDKDKLAKELGADVFVSVYRNLGAKRSAVESRVVLASLQPISNHVAGLTVDQITTSSDARSLGLIDYMYFSIYTITTTGYGDIVPTTAYAKFVTSIANLCEVLFLVVFFNALISLRPKSDGPDANQAAPPVTIRPPGDEGMQDGQEHGQRAVLQGAFGRE